MRNNYNYYPNNYNRMNYDEFINNLNFPQNAMQNQMEINQNQQSNNTLYSPYEGYTKGNLFKNLYDEYKDYQPTRLLPKSEEEEALLNLNQMQFAMHEANLYLDVYPNDNNMMNEYNKARANYNNILREYQNKYGSLLVNSDSLNQIPFGWEEEVWPWDRRGL